MARITEESVSLDASEQGFVGLRHVQVEGGRDFGGQLWLERGNLPWLVESMRACLEVYAFPGAETRGGDDSLSVRETGPEQAPYVNIQNRRPAASPHGGVYALFVSRPVAEDLLARLSELR